VVEVLPRDDLFQTPVDELFSTVMSIVQIQERNKIRVFLRKDPYGRFCYCLAYVPRDYSTEVRQKIQQVLMERLKATDCEFWTFFSESVLARVQLILRVDPKNRIDIDPAAGKRSGAGLPQLAGRLLQPGGGKLQPTAPTCWRTSRKASRPATASALPRIRRWSTCSTCSASPKPTRGDELLPAAGPGLRPELCKLYHADTLLALSDVLPILENLGLRVLGEFPYRLRHANGREFWIHDFAFTAEGVNPISSSSTTPCRTLRASPSGRRRERCVQPPGLTAGCRGATWRCCAPMPVT
jgi:glutamate dehydrogenase